MEFHLFKWNYYDFFTEPLSSNPPPLPPVRPQHVAPAGTVGASVATAAAVAATAKAAASAKITAGQPNPPQVQSQLTAADMAELLKVAISPLKEQSLLTTNVMLTLGARIGNKKLLF